MFDQNLIQDLHHWELDSYYFKKFHSRTVFSRWFIKHLNYHSELKGHEGCVNCLEWNQAGTILASGSDDQRIILWDPFRRKQLQKIETKHRGNIFGVKFLPGTNDTFMASAAADRDIYVYDVNKNLTINEIHSHQNRVKQIETAQDMPFLFWSCGEDGHVLQHDIRCKPAEASSILLNYSSAGLVDVKNSEAKCLAINQARSEYLAVGLGDPFARIYDRRMLELRSISHRDSQSASSSGNTRKTLFEYKLLDYIDPTKIPLTHYVPGHLPKRIDEYRRRMKTLSITFLSFNPNGTELLANLGGEQLYLFDLSDESSKPAKYDSYRTLFDESDLVEILPESKSSSSETIPDSDSQKINNKKKFKLSPKAEALKLKANASFEEQNYVEAIEYYNQAILLAENSPILYGNRAATLMKRNWDGDVYAAMRDCYTALIMDKTHLKSHFRLAKCLNDLKWHQEARECLEFFSTRFPDYAKSQACENLIEDIDKALKGSKNKETTEEEDNSDTEWTTMSESESENLDLSKKPKLNEEESDFSESLSANNDKILKKIYLQKKMNAVDFSSRFCGHCNVATDIKEANFIGENFIAAGSDDGSFFIWDKKTTNIVKVLHGDESIVNCVQPHPYSCYIATSGIDSEIRLWSPNFDEALTDEEDRVVTDVKSAVLNNQVKMNSHPFEYLFLNLTQNSNWNNEESGGHQNVECRQS